MTSSGTSETLRVSKRSDASYLRSEEDTFRTGSQETHGKLPQESPAGKRRHYSSSDDDQESACKRLRVQSESPSREGTGSLWTEVKFLGEGTFGIVTLVKDESTGELAARKSVEILTEEDEQEFLIHRRLDHVNVVMLLSAEQEGNEMLLYLEYAAGGDLSDEIEHCGLGDEKAHFYFVQLVNGVDYLHAQGIAHRDLKPKNLMLSEDRVLKIGDFGLSAEFLYGGEEVYLRGADGSRSYMAPEVFSRRYRGPPADIWSCGIILVEMVTGRTPWRRARPRDSTYHQWMQLQHLKKISDDPRPTSSSDTSVVELISYILTPDPEERATLPGIKENGWFKK
ncbi:serine/threonine-protein kinase Chk1-like [Oratosquilla oratoria]|uniref:serine/threonine-protein kinase Chk1-like n=1 Tax=Oratosquilla oratoria TaxID=337810 RepID=UPI003F76B971